MDLCDKSVLWCVKHSVEARRRLEPVAYLVCLNKQVDRAVEELRLAGWEMWLHRRCSIGRHSTSFQTRNAQYIKTGSKQLYTNGEHYRR